MKDKPKYRAFELVRDIARAELSDFSSALRQVQQERKETLRATGDSEQSQTSNQSPPDNDIPIS